MPTVPDEVIIGDAVRLVHEGMAVTLLVKGRSMLPFILGGLESVVLTRPGEIHPGDVVLARIDGQRYVLHRVIKVEADCVTLMGDGNLSGTESCPPEEVLGIVTAIQRGKRSVKPGKGKWWRAIPLFFRRYLLAIYRRII